MHGSAQSEGLAGPRFDNLLWTCAKFSAIQVKFLPTFYVVTYSWWIISSHFHGTMEGTSPSRKSSRLPGMANVDPTCWQGRKKKHLTLEFQVCHLVGNLDEPEFWTPAAYDWLNIIKCLSTICPCLTSVCLGGPSPSILTCDMSPSLPNLTAEFCVRSTGLDPEARAPVEEAGPWEIRKVVLSFKKSQPLNRLTFLDLVLTASASSENRIMAEHAAACTAWSFRAWYLQRHNICHDVHSVFCWTTQLQPVQMLVLFGNFCGVLCQDWSKVQA